MADPTPLRKPVGAWGWAAAGFIAVGVAARLRIFFYNRSLWRDEAALGLTYVRQSMGDLLNTGDYVSDQAAPIGFSLLERLAVDLLGPTDWALRLVPLLAGIAVLPLLFATVRRLAGREVAALTVGLAALCMPAVYYSTELKQYSLDMLLAVLMFRLALRYRTEPLTNRKALALGATGALMSFFSQPLIFVLAACGIGLVVEQWRQGMNRHRVAALGTLAAAWIAGFAVNMLLFIRPQMQDDWIFEYHAGNFLPIVPGSSAELVAAARTVASAMAFLTGFTSAELVLFLFLAGLIVLVARRAWFPLVFALSWVMAALASTAHLYPFVSRLLLYALPGVLFTIAYGLHALVPDRRWRPILLVAGFGLVGWSSYADVASATLHPRSHSLLNRAQAKHGLEHIRDFGRSGDVVCVRHEARFPVAFYVDRYLPDDIRVLHEGRRGRQELGCAVRAVGLARTGRVWVLFEPFWSRSDRNRAEQVSILEQLGRLGGVELDRYEFVTGGTSGVSVFLYGFGGPGDAEEADSHDAAEPVGTPASGAGRDPVTDPGY